MTKRWVLLIFDYFMFKRVLKLLLYVFALGLIVSGVVVSLVAGTQAGSRWLVTQAVGLSAGQVTVGQVQGSFFFFVLIV